MPQWNSAEFASFKSPVTSLSRVIKEKQMFSKVLLMLFGWKFLMMHWTNCHQAEKSVRKWLNQNSILSFQMLTGIHKQDTRSKSHRILLLLLIEVHLQRVMSMFYLYLLTITTQLLEQWALLTRVLPSIWLCQVNLMFTQVDPTLSCLLVSTTVKVTWASWEGNSEAEKEKLIGLLIKSWILKKSVQGTESSSTTLEGERQQFETEDKLYVLLSCLTQLHQTVRKATWPLFVNSPEHTWGKCKRPLEKIPPSCRCRTGPWEFCQMFGWHGSRSE